MLHLRLLPGSLCRGHIQAIRHTFMVMLSMVVRFLFIRRQGTVEIIRATACAFKLDGGMRNKVHIPLRFWHTQLGMLINIGHRRCTPDSAFLSIIEAAKEVNVTRQTIYNWLEQGQVFPVWGEGGEPRVLEIDVRRAARRPQDPSLVESEEAALS
jgi:hypothetical protein